MKIGKFTLEVQKMTEPPKDIPPWLRHFLVHVVKRCAMILVKWIDDLGSL